MRRLLKNPMRDEDYIQMRRLAVQLLAKHLNQNVEDWEQVQGISGEHYENLVQLFTRKSTSKN